MSEQCHVSQTSVNATAANINGTPFDNRGNKSLWAHVVNTGSGTCTVTLEGQDPLGNWYALGYQRVDGQATLTRAVAAISVTAGFAATYQILDYYSSVRARVTAQSGTIATTVHFYGTTI